MKRDKSYSGLLAACILIWLAVFILVVASIVVSFKQQSQWKVEESIVVTGNNNQVIIAREEKKPEKSIKKESKVTAYAIRVLEATTVWTKYYTLDEAVELTAQIRKAAYRNHLRLEEAFCIVHIESDFRKNAYNKYGKAYGLCQVTQPCLDEYNWHHNTHYTLNDMFDVEKNLEVGFWYYDRLIYHYGSEFGITTTNEYSLIRDAYIAYNIGITKFKDLGTNGRNELRRGIYPCRMYGFKKGDVYTPMLRFKSKADVWLKAN